MNEDSEQNAARNQATTTEGARKPRGFAAMDPNLVSELAKRGGKAAHRAGTAINSRATRLASPAQRRHGVAREAHSYRHAVESS